MWDLEKQVDLEMAKFQRCGGVVARESVRDEGRGRGRRKRRGREEW